MLACILVPCISCSLLPQYWATNSIIHYCSQCHLRLAVYKQFWGRGHGPYVFVRSGHPDAVTAVGDASEPARCNNSPLDASELARQHTTTYYRNGGVFSDSLRPEVAEQYVFVVDRPSGAINVHIGNASGPVLIIARPEGPGFGLRFRRPASTDSSSSAGLDVGRVLFDGLSSHCQVRIRHNDGLQVRRLRLEWFFHTEFCDWDSYMGPVMWSKRTEWAGTEEFRRYPGLESSQPSGFLSRDVDVRRLLDPFDRVIGMCVLGKRLWLNGEFSSWFRDEVVISALAIEAMAKEWRRLQPPPESF